MNDWQGSLRLGAELESLAGKFREGSEAPFARALLALARHGLGDAQAAAALDAVFEELRTVDAKLRLAYTLTRAARIDLQQGNAHRARSRAEEAHRTATIIGRPTEALLAGVTLARACRELGDEAEVERLLGELRGAPIAGASQIARRELSELLDDSLSAPARSRTAAPSKETGS